MRGAMNCGQCEALLPDYVEGELDATERRVIEDHLSSCESCRRSHAFMALLEETLRSRRDEMPPPRLVADAVLRRLNLPDRRPRRARPWFGPALTATAAVAVSLLGIFRPEPLALLLRRMSDWHADTFDLFARLPAWISAAAGGEFWILLGVYIALTSVFAAAGGMIVRRSMQG